MRFNDDEHLKTFYNTGAYPKIHDDIFSMHKDVPVCNVIDLGCCTGLLSHRLGTVYNKVIGIEPNKTYYSKCVPRVNVKYVNMGINYQTLVKLSRIIEKYDVRAIYARRVIPEIWETGGMNLVEGFIKTIHSSGVEYIVIEGRKSTKNAKNPLHSVIEEGKIFGRWYTCVKEYKNCQILKRKDV